MKNLVCVVLILLILLILLLIINKFCLNKNSNFKNYNFKNNKLITPEFDGEFGHEIDRIIPFLYKMYLNGKIFKIKYMESLRILYESIFPKSILIRVKNYNRKAGIGKSGWDKIISKDNHISINKIPWKAPNWIGKFKNIPIKFSHNKKLLIIHNKYTIEWNDKPINFIPLNIIKDLYNKWNKFFHIIIFHPTQESKGYVKDEQKMFKIFDYSGIQTIQDIMKNNPNLDYNTLQFILHDKCKHFISIQGGSSRIASMFGGINIVLHKKGSEVKNNEYNNVLSHLSDVTIKVISNEKDLININLDIL